MTTNKNYLLVMGRGEWSLYHSCGPFDINPDGVLLVKEIVFGAARIGPKGEDPDKCVILTNMQNDITAWGLIDYRQAFSDADIAQAQENLRNNLPEEVRPYVVINSTQDEGFRDTAVGS